jgi:hypothetical protein
MSTYSPANNFTFRDSGFSGFGSPINFVQKEIGILWPQGKVGLTVKIGPDLKAFALPSAKEDWTATEAQVKALSEKLLNRVPGLARTENTIACAQSIVKEFVGIALEMELALNDYSDSVANAK